jgi:hypothetical protein
MISVMLYLHPDSKERRTDWIIPLVASPDDRKEWELALLDYIHTGMSSLFIYHIPYCSTSSVHTSRESFPSILYQIPSMYYFNRLNADLVWREGSLCSHLRG